MSPALKSCWIFSLAMQSSTVGLELLRSYRGPIAIHAISLFFPRYVFGHRDTLSWHFGPRLPASPSWQKSIRRQSELGRCFETSMIHAVVVPLEIHRALPLLSFCVKQ